MIRGRIFTGFQDNCASPVETYKFEPLQLQELRKTISKTEKMERQRPAGKKSIAIISGKGGVGKSNFALNFALVTGKKLKRPAAIIDADLGMANLDVLLGLNTRLNMDHVIRGELSLKEIILPVAERVWLVPGGSGIPEVAQLDSCTKKRLMPEISALDEMVDVIVIDTGAGIHSTVREFSMAADAIVLVTTPEPTALRDAYGMIKSLYSIYGASVLGGKDIFLAVNMAYSEKEAKDCAQRLISACSHFLEVNINFLGYLPYDVKMAKAVKNSCPLSELYPGSSTVKRLESMTSRLLSFGDNPVKIDGEARGPMEKLLHNMLGKLKSN